MYVLVTSTYTSSTSTDDDLGGGVLQRICWADVIHFTRATVAQNSNSTVSTDDE